MLHNRPASLAFNNEYVLLSRLAYFAIFCCLHNITHWAFVSSDWHTLPVYYIYIRLGTGSRMLLQRHSWTDVLCLPASWWHFSAWNDVTAAILKLWHQIKNPAPPILCIFTWGAFLPNFIPIRFETMEP